RPRSGESLHNAPGTAAKTVPLFFGLTAIRATRSDLSKPTCVHVSPPSMDLQTPSPIEALLRVQDSPVPTQTFFMLFGSIAIAPTDCTGCSSNTGRYRVPPSSDFHTPPLAAPTKSVIFPEGSLVAAMAEMRPLMVAEPMFRTPSPEIVAGPYGVSSAWEIIARKNRAVAIRKDFRKRMNERTTNYLEAVVGKRKVASSTGTLPSALSITTFCLSGSPFRPVSIEKGINTPLIFS